MKLIDNVVGLFIGPSSKQRQIGIGGALFTSAVYYFGWIDVGLYEWMMKAWVFWTGAAFSAKLSKLANMTKDMKHGKN